MREPEELVAELNVRERPACFPGVMDALVGGGLREKDASVPPTVMPLACMTSDDLPNWRAFDMFASGCSAGNDELTANDWRFTLNGCSDMSVIPFVGSTRAGIGDDVFLYQ